MGWGWGIAQVLGRGGKLGLETNRALLDLKVLRMGKFKLFRSRPSFPLGQCVSLGNLKNP